MGHAYKAVQWNGNKFVYDIYLIVAVAAYLIIFMLIGLQPHASGHVADPVVLMIRALGTCAFLMLTFILSIGPLARLSRRFYPMLYNRRHFGVLTFIVAAAHFGLALLWYHGGGPINPLLSLFTSNPLYDSIPGFPFEILGFIAFLILFMMAATSHDFWLNNLSAPLWKALHMLVYPAYALLVMHIVLGALMTEKAPIHIVLTLGAFAFVAGLHLVTGMREWRDDNRLKKGRTKGWVDAGVPSDIQDKRAIIVPLATGDRVAIFRDGDKLHAVTNACRHQNGPLGEGKIVDGCITCPWHGWQYRPDDGISPPPFTEKIATYNLTLSEGRILLNPQPNRPGTKVSPVLIPENLLAAEASE